MRKLVRDRSPAELEKINEEKLKEMGVSGKMRRRFLEHPDFNPQEETLLVGALSEMEGVRGRHLFIASAVQADSESVARYMRQRAEMMERYHRKVGPARSLVTLEGTCFLKRSNGALVGLFPLDHVALTGKLWRKASAVTSAAPEGAGGRRALWITGSISPNARKALESLGWEVVDGAGQKLF